MGGGGKLEEHGIIKFKARWLFFNGFRFTVGREQKFRKQGVVLVENVVDPHYCHEIVHSEWLK